MIWKVFVVYNYIFAFHQMQAFPKYIYIYSYDHAALRSKAKVDGFKSNLNKYHDELADLKSYFDGHRDDDSFDPKNLFCSYVSIYYKHMYPEQEIHKT